jgi:hypothetical protein
MFRVNLENGPLQDRAAGTALSKTRRHFRRQAATLTLAVSLQLLQITRVRAENEVGYRYESYKEDAGRISIETHAALFSVKPAPWLDLKGQVVYDAISGATPTGAPPLSQINVLNVFTGQPLKGLSKKVPVVAIDDTRYAGGLEATLSFGRHHFTPGMAYSEESDYISYGPSLNYSIDLNEKNTTLSAGWAHNADQVLHADEWKPKDADDFFVGVNQLLGPTTVLTANFTYGRAHGYLDDPYKGVFFDGSTIFKDPTDPSPLIPPTSYESRPRHREKYIGYASLTQFITPLNASIEGSYRLFDDSYGVVSHTVGLTWFQKIGKHVVVSPLFRYTHQGEADFYVTRLPGTENSPTTPRYYSSDYRLSNLETFTYGVTATARITEWFSLDAGYKRYEMFGLDGVTSKSAYPKAHIFSIGARLWF